MVFKIHQKWLAAAALTIVAVMSSPVAAQCSGEDMVDLTRSGTSLEALTEMCGSEAVAPSTGAEMGGAEAAPLATVCMTDYGACPMGIEMTVGEPCACIGEDQEIPGTAQ